MDESDPDITFDNDGICNHCRQYEVDEKKRQAEAGNLSLILNKLRKGCLLGLSGGVDSSLTLHYLVENGIKPLCFSLDNKWDTEESAANVKNLVEKLNVPYIKYKINMEKYRELQDAFLWGGIKNVEAITDHILFAVTYKIANDFGIKYIVTGGNLATENTMPSAWGEDPRDLYWIKSIYRINTGKKLTGLPTISLLKEQYYRLIKRIKFIPLLDYYDYDRNEAIKFLQEKYDYKSYGDKHCENVFTKWYQNYYLPVKWGIDKRKAHLSSLIHSGQMTKEDALKELERPLDYPEIEVSVPMLKKSYHDYPNSERARKIVIKFYKYGKMAMQMVADFGRT
jgi:tRNA(Ile)-lysidine synthase TilS/MesJ